MSQQRLKHIDNAKAIGMMLIIASHVLTTDALSESVSFRVWDAVPNSFYVPLFFILSGVFESSSADWSKYLHRLKTIATYLLVFALFGFISVGLTRGKWSIGSCLNGTVIWFLFTLSWITAIFGLVKRLKLAKLIVLLLAFAGMYLSHKGHSYFYFGQALLCFPFYAVGYYFKNFIKSQNISHLFIRPMMYFELFQMTMASLLLYYLWTEYREYGVRQTVTLFFCGVIALNTVWDIYKSSGNPPLLDTKTYKVFLFHTSKNKPIGL